MNSTSSPGASPTGWEPPSPEALQAMLPQYEITGILGRGGMGAVYKGRQVRLDREVAIKVLPETLTQGGDDEMQFAARFELEAQAMAKFSHPSIVSVFDFGETAEGQLYFVMEFVEGMDIHQYLNANGRVLPQDSALSITAHVLDALEYAHSRGIVHRDIKPANILLNTEGQVKIADFGLAKSMATGGEDDGPALTMTNMALGTPDFVAPEALDCDVVPDHRADLYAVGVMLYQMLTGKLPRGQFKMPGELVPELDPRLDEIVSHSLQAIPDDRYSSASDMRLAMDPVITSPMSRMEMVKQQEVRAQEIQASQGQLAKKRKAKTGVYIGAGVAALLAIGGLAAFLMDSGDEQSEAKTPVAEATEPIPPSIKQNQPKKPIEVATSSSEKKLASPSLGNTATAMPSATKAKPAPQPASIARKPVTTQAPANITPPEKPADNAPEPTVSNLVAIPGLKTRLDGYHTARSTQVGELATKYLTGLETRLNQAADAGDLILVKAFKEEKVAVQKLQQSLIKKPADPVAGVAELATLPPLDADAPDGLKTLRKIWTSERQKIRGTLDVALQQSLSALEKQLTKSRDFANAEKILAYRGSFGAADPAMATAPVPVKKPAPVPVGESSSVLASATKDEPFENSLGMKFVPVPITGGPSDGKTVLFSIWETRVKDYAAFIKNNQEHHWPKADFPQKDDHPAVKVSWDDAQAFCEWLTKEDRKKGKLGKGDRYRLPTDHEWSCALGIGKEEDAEKNPQDKDSKIANIYPWGKKFPPPKGVGNFYGEESKQNPFEDRKPIEGYDDGFDRTAPVGSFEANEYGLNDMGGNVSEWCEDLISTARKSRVVRGASWYNNEEAKLLSSNRDGHSNSARGPNSGFRVVLAFDETEESPQKPIAPEPLAGGTNTARGVASATKARPYENSLGMRFVPVPITSGPSDGATVLFSIWETRVEDYAAFIKENKGREWPDTDFKQRDDHPAVNVTWEDAQAFCEWLTEEDRKKGELGKDERYRLPSDHEWSCAVGIGKEEDADAIPIAKRGKITDIYTWGKKFPPPKGAGNYYGEETNRNPFRTLKPMDGYDDGYDRTASVGSFEVNEYGLYDMGGNVREWCEDWYSTKQEKRVLRGGCWVDPSESSLRSSWRNAYTPSGRFIDFGFRVVVAIGGMEARPPKPVAP